MATYYDLIDLKNKRRIGLGNGPWRDTALDGGTPMTVDEVRSKVACLGLLANLQIGAADRIWAFCKVAEWRVAFCAYAGDYPERALDPDPCAERTAAALERTRGMK